MTQRGHMDYWLRSGQTTQVRAGVTEEVFSNVSPTQVPCDTLTGFHRAGKLKGRSLSFIWRPRSKNICLSSHLASRADVAAVRAEIDGDDGAVVRRQHGCKNVLLVRAATKQPSVCVFRVNTQGWTDRRTDEGKEGGITHPKRMRGDCVQSQSHMEQVHR